MRERSGDVESGGLAGQLSAAKRRCAIAASSDCWP